MTPEFTGKRVWVTGAGRGIGRAIAEAFVREGAEVIGLDIAFENSALPYRTETLDVACSASIERLCGALLAEQERLDILVHAAGVLRLGGIEALTPEDWQACMAVNAGGAFHLLRVLAPLFRRQRSGAVVAVASNAGHVPRIGMAAYGASKAALASLVQSVGLELAPYGVRCNLVSPGSTDTEMLRGMWKDAADGAAQTITGDPAQFRLGIPLGKLAQVEDIAQAVLFLASDRAGHVTLQDLVIDGGATLGA
jgi:2,3-dihydro-2,3-dihydroxybenzoate dehydrogenase